MGTFKEKKTELHNVMNIRPQTHTQIYSYSCEKKLKYNIWQEQTQLIATWGKTKEGNMRNINMKLKTNLWL